MPIRITGMNSGLDTESIISELVKAQKTKVDSVKKTDNDSVETGCLERIKCQDL